MLYVFEFVNYLFRC